MTVIAKVPEHAPAVWLAPTASDEETLMVAEPAVRLDGTSLPRVAVIAVPGPVSELVASMVVVNALVPSPVTEKMPWEGEPPSAATPPVTARTPAVEMVTVPT